MQRILRDVTSKRTVKQLQLSEALTITENMSIREVCHQMAACRVDALLLIDSNALLSGILTDKDIVTRVIACEVTLDNTPVSNIMTRNPVSVHSDILVVEALQKMVRGYINNLDQHIHFVFNLLLVYSHRMNPIFVSTRKFRHLPILGNGEVIALLDIAKCMYDAISCMERAAEKGQAIAAAIERVEKHWVTSISGLMSYLSIGSLTSPNTFIDTLRERMFRPSLSTIILENSRWEISSLVIDICYISKLFIMGNMKGHSFTSLELSGSGIFKMVTVSPSVSVLTATKQMLEFQSSSTIITVENKPRGILTSKDILMQIIAQNLSPESTLVEKVMTSNPECASVDTPIVDALHIMHDGKFLHLPVVDRDGAVVVVIDAIHITHAAVATVGSGCGVGNEAANTMMQKFWDSAMTLGPLDDDEENRSKESMKLTSEGSIELLGDGSYQFMGNGPYSVNKQSNSESEESHTDNEESDTILKHDKNFEGRLNYSIFSRNQNFRKPNTKAQPNYSIFTHNQNIRKLNTECRQNYSVFSHNQNVQKNDNTSNRSQNGPGLNTKAQKRISTFTRNQNGSHIRKNKEYNFDVESKETGTEKPESNTTLNRNQTVRKLSTKIQKSNSTFNRNQNPQKINTIAQKNGNKSVNNLRKGGRPQWK